MKGQIVNVLGFAGIQTQWQLFSSAIVTLWNGHGCVPLKFYLQKQKSCWIFKLFFGHDTWHIGILVPQPGIKLVASAVEAWSVNHWAAREVISLC